MDEASRRPRWTPPGPRRSRPAGPANGSRSSTTRSATAPGREHRPRRRGGSPTRCRRCTPRTRSRASSACSGRNGSVPARPLGVRRAGDGRRGSPAAGPGVLTGQSLPRDQPGAGAVQVAEGVLPAGPLLAQERERQVDHLLVVAGPQRLHVGRDAELARTAARRRGGPAAGARRGGGGPGRCPTIASSVSRTPRSPIACTCTWKPAASSARTASRIARRVDEGVAACCRSRGRSGRGTASSIAAVPFSATPSCMILTVVARNRPPVSASRRPTRSATCSTPAPALPPQRADDVRAQVAAARPPPT